MPKTPQVIAVLFLLVVVLAGIIAYRNLGDDEINVYISFIESMQPMADVYEAAFISATTNCGIDRHRSDNELLFSELIKANQDERGVRNLNKLAGLANIVSYETVLTARNSEISVSSLSNRIIVRLSRVGFNADKSIAILCVESKLMGDVIYFKKTGFNIWKQTSSKNIWVS